MRTAEAAITTIGTCPICHDSIRLTQATAEVSEIVYHEECAQSRFVSYHVIAGWNELWLDAVILSKGAKSARIALYNEKRRCLEERTVRLASLTPRTEQSIVDEKVAAREGQRDQKQEG